jgi:hypothetical protein
MPFSNIVLEPTDRKTIDQLPRLDGVVNLKDGIAKSCDTEVGVEGHRRLKNKENMTSVYTFPSCEL